MRTRIYPHREPPLVPATLANHPESLPNASAIFTVSSIADQDDIVAAIRTAVLLARTSGTSLSVTVLDDQVLHAESGNPVPQENLEDLLNSVRLKLLMPRQMQRKTSFALEASIASASFLNAGAIALHVRSVDSLSLTTSSSR